MPETQTPVNHPLVANHPQESRLNKKYRSYKLFYHFRAAAPLDLVFEMDGTLKDAIERGRLHCDRMNYRFIKVRPFVVDLDEREARRNEDPEMGNDY